MSQTHDLVRKHLDNADAAHPSDRGDSMTYGSGALFGLNGKTTRAERKGIALWNLHQAKLALGRHMSLMHRKGT